MSGRTIPGGDVGGCLTRRALLAGSASVLGGAGLAGSTAGQEITVPAMIPRPDRWADENLAGFMIHVGGATDPAEEGATENCDFADWPPPQTLVYDAALINRKQADTPEEGTLLYTAEDASIPAGALFLINTFERCEPAYVGLQIKQIGRFDVGEAGGEAATDYGPVADVEEDERPNPPTTTGPGAFGAVGPGVGVVGSLAAFLAGGAYLGRRRKED